MNPPANENYPHTKIFCGFLGLNHARFRIGLKTSVRLKADLWQDDKANSKTKSTVFCIFRRAFLAVAESICGVEAGAASLSAFNRKKHSKGNVLSLPAEETSQIFRLLAAGMTATKRNSVEQRIRRIRLR
ncbi:hypothetical protein PR002_g20294 [Phytophthora rubi]|uniref:Uncharacterized protein n=1 Tax=Phytophthora rubi TaxID=129364 RepID=A0A6A3JLD1_9STRA|nr:hypothetical protein PR002_g20294 [Phytophthora rubi]